MSPELQNAFRYHMRNNRPAFYHAQGYNGRNAELDSGFADQVPAICRLIRSEMREVLANISKARVKRAELVNGDSDDLIFWTGETRLREAFCEGAGLQVFPC